MRGEEKNAYHKVPGNWRCTTANKGTNGIERTDEDDVYIGQPGFLSAESLLHFYIFGTV